MCNTQLLLSGNPQPLISVKCGEVQLKTLRQAERFGSVYHINRSDYDEGDNYTLFREKLRQCENFEQTQECHARFNNGNLVEYYECLAMLFNEHGNSYMELKCRVKALLISYRNILWREHVPQSRYIFLRHELLHHGYKREAERLDAYHLHMVCRTW